MICIYRRESRRESARVEELAEEEERETRERRRVEVTSSEVELAPLSFLPSFAVTPPSTSSYIRVLTDISPDTSDPTRSVPREKAKAEGRRGGRECLAEKGGGKELDSQCFQVFSSLTTDLGDLGSAGEPVGGGEDLSRRKGRGKRGGEGEMRFEGQTSGPARAFELELVVKCFKLRRDRVYSFE